MTLKEVRMRALYVALAALVAVWGISGFYDYGLSSSVRLVLGMALLIPAIAFFVFITDFQGGKYRWVGILVFVCLVIMFTMSYLKNY